MFTKGFTKLAINLPIPKGQGMRSPRINPVSAQDALGATPDLMPNKIKAVGSGFGKGHRPRSLVPLSHA
jgi:hypothetical protein